jgi:predicted MFS family arabinose efflux permease
LLACVFVGVVLSGFSYQTLMPGYLENVLGHPASQLGLLFGATAGGGILVTLVLALIGPRMRNPGVVMLGFGAALAGALALLAVAPSFAVALGVGALVGASSSGFQMLNNINLMARTNPVYFGRVMAVTMMAFGVNAIVAYPVGVVADAVGERTTLAGLAGTCLAVVLGGLLALRSVPKRAQDKTRSPEPRVVIERG